MKFIYKISFIICFSFLLGFPFQQIQAQDIDKRIVTNQERVITIYPVPARSVAHIRMSPALKAEVNKIEIINLIGKKITEQTIIDKNASEIIFSNLNELPKGIYIVVTRDKFGKILLSAKMILDN